MTRRLSIKDIARISGVSITTVSRVINQPQLVNSKTRKTVEEVIDKYDYIPNEDARNFSKQISTIFCVIVPEINNAYWSKYIQVVSKLAMENNYTVICFSSEDDFKTEQRILKMICQINIAGLFFAPCRSTNSSQKQKVIKKYLDMLRVPVILVDRRADYLNRTGVFFDDFQGVYLATRFLLEKQHHEIALIGGSLDLQQTHDRLNGYLEAFNDQKIKSKEEYTFLGEYSIDFSYKTAKCLLKQKNKPTAIICLNNSLTLGLIKAITEVDSNLFNEIEIVGLDEIDVLNYMNSDLNFIRRDSSILAYAAMYLMFNQLNIRVKEPWNIISDGQVLKKYINKQSSSYSTYKTLPEDSYLFDTEFLINSK